MKKAKEKEKEKQPWSRSAERAAKAPKDIPEQSTGRFDNLVFVALPDDKMPETRMSKATRMRSKVRKVLRDISSGMRISHACEKHNISLYDFNRYVNKEKLSEAYRNRSLVAFSKLEELDRLLYEDKITAIKHEQLSKSLRWQLRSLDPEFSEKSPGKASIDVNVRHGIELPAHIEDSLSIMAKVIDVPLLEITNEDS